MIRLKKSVLFRRISCTVTPAIADRSEGFLHCAAPPQRRTKRCLSVCIFSSCISSFFYIFITKKFHSFHVFHFSIFFIFSFFSCFSFFFVSLYFSVFHFQKTQMARFPSRVWHPGDWRRLRRKDSQRKWATRRARCAHALRTPAYSLPT